MQSALAGRRRVSRPSRASSALPPIWQVVGAFVAPTTAITALLYYFGWVRASTTYGYFGVDVERTLGFSAADYVRRSSTIVFTPLAGFTLLSLVILRGTHAVDQYLRQPVNHKHIAHVAHVASAAATLLLVTAAVLLKEPSWVAKTPLIKPLSLAMGATCATYSGHVRNLQADGQANSEAGQHLFAALYKGLLGGLIVLALFWATAIVALEQGLRAAHALERGLPAAPGVVVYAHDNQYITGLGVKYVSLDPANSAYRFRYTGLRLLARTADGGYVLLPRGWVHAYGNPAYVIPSNAGIRVDLQALPAD